jgi:capsid protein
MLKGLRKLFSPRRAESWFKAREKSDTPEGPTAVRRWDAAKTDRLNKAHWGKVTGTTLNVDLSTWHETLRTRAEYEMANNSDAEGTVNTHVVDVVGEDGPKLQVQSESKAYNEALEKAWRKWWANPDVNGQLSGVDILQMWVRSLWSAGEYLAQIVVDKDAPEPNQHRLLCLHTRRLFTPSKEAADSTVFMGVKRDKQGKPLSYYISEPPEGVLPGQGTLSTDFKNPEAADIIHQFKVLEPGQVRGVPWLATGMQAIADARDYDNEVLDAARAAADSGILLHTNSSGG